MYLTALFWYYFLENLLIRNKRAFCDECVANCRRDGKPAICAQRTCICQGHEHAEPKRQYS